MLAAWVKQVADAQVDPDRMSKDQLAAALATPPVSRRLNRTEYGNTLRDLFGIELHAGDLLPSEGGGGEGFDTAGATLFITPMLLEKYLEAAELVLGTLFPAPDNKPRVKTIGDAFRLAAARRSVLVAVPGPGLPPRDAARKVLEAFVPAPSAGRPPSPRSTATSPSSTAPTSGATPTSRPSSSRSRAC